MSRIYLDYNATSPLSEKVINFIREGDLPFANPSSFHSSGKYARKHINTTSNYLFEKFDLDNSCYDIIYHSGATEFYNTLFLNSPFAIFYFPSDHSCVGETAQREKIKGRDVFELKLDSAGDFDFDQVVKLINDYKSSSGNQVLLNYTWVHNETGVVWPLHIASKIKAQTNCLIHVDAVQSIGKIENFLRLEDDLDYYTYSAHKFGALKSVGFSFVKKDADLEPLIIGGGQQKNMRSGTENAIGVYSIKLALEDLIERFNFPLALSFKNSVEEKIIKLLGPNGEVIGSNAKYGRNCNTINFVLYHKKADISLIQFDMHSIDVSSGSACSVQALKDSPTLVAMGKSEVATNSIRISMGPMEYKEPQKLEGVYRVISKLVN